MLAKSYQRTLLLEAVAVAAQHQHDAEVQAKQLQHAKDTNLVPVQRDWLEDLKKKNNNGTCVCLRCKNTFKGKRRRKHCFDCQPLVEATRKAEVEERERYPYGRHY